MKSRGRYIFTFICTSYFIIAF